MKRKLSLNKIRERISLKVKLVEQYGLCCYYCGEYFEYDRLTLDHIFPRSKGGKDSLGNLVLACYACNREKNDTVISIEEFKNKKQGITPITLTPEEKEEIREIIQNNIDKNKLINYKPLKERIKGPEQVEFIYKKPTVKRFLGGIKDLWKSLIDMSDKAQ